jgi:hypothetical protein
MIVQGVTLVAISIVPVVLCFLVGAVNDLTRRIDAMETALVESLFKLERREGER